MLELVIIGTLAAVALGMCLLCSGLTANTVYWKKEAQLYKDERDQAMDVLIESRAKLRELIKYIHGQGPVGPIGEPEEMGPGP